MLVFKSLRHRYLFITQVAVFSFFLMTAFQNCTSGSSFNTPAADTANSGQNSNDIPVANLNYSSKNSHYIKNVSIAPNQPLLDGDFKPIIYNISPALPAGLSLDAQSGVISGVPQNIISESSFTISLVGTDSSGNSSTLSTQITFDVLEPIPHISYSQSLLSVYANYDTINLSLVNSGGVPDSLSISPALPNGLIFDTSSGLISGKPTQTQSLTQYVITATNSSGESSFNLQIEVKSLPTTFTYSQTNLILTKGVAISQINPILPSSGGVTVTASAYAVTPTLPAGLTLNTTSGVIKGTPTVLSASKSYTITAITNVGSLSTSITIEVDDKAPVISYASTNYVYYYGMSVSQPAIVSGGAITSVSISPSLPTGLAISSPSALISGTVTQVSPSTSYTVQAKNATGTSSFVFSLQVLADPTVFSYANAQLNLNLNQAMSNNSPVLPSVSPYVFTSGVYSVVSGTLPSGLILNSSTGVISGTPTQVQSTIRYVIQYKAYLSNVSVTLLAPLDLTISDPKACSDSELAALESQMSSILDTALITTSNGSSVSPPAFTLMMERGDGHQYIYNHLDSTPSTSYQSASTSKLVTASIIMSLVDRGILSLDDHPQKYLTSTAAIVSGSTTRLVWPTTGDASTMTLRQLLAFTSGLINDPPTVATVGVQKYSCIDVSPNQKVFPYTPMEDCAGLILSSNFTTSGTIVSGAAAPGAKFNYNSNHLQIAGMMAIKAAIQAGMVNSVTGQVVTGWLDIYNDFQKRTGFFPNSTYDLPSAINPRLAGGMHWIASDYLQFLKFLRQNKSIKANALYTNTTNFVELFKDQRGSATASIAGSPVWSGIGMDWHYACGNWVECTVNSSITDQASCSSASGNWYTSLGQGTCCIPNGRNSSPGMYGSYPFIDNTYNYFGILGTYITDSGFRQGYALFSQLGSLPQKWASGICH